MNKPAQLAASLAGGKAVPASQATHIEQSRAIAEVQAAFVVAQSRPRSEPQAIEMIREACGQLRLAQRAFFRYSRGDGMVTGASIHLAVELARYWQNVSCGLRELTRDDVKGESEMLAYAADLQLNSRFDTTFIVPHRRDTKSGPRTLTETRDIYENNANQGARRLREMIFRLIPTHVRIEAEQLCRETLERGDSTKTLAQRIADCIAGFEQLGISRTRLEHKLGLKVEAITAVDLGVLQVSYESIRHHEVTAEDEFPQVGAQLLGAALKGGPQPAPTATPAPPPPPPTATPPPPAGPALAAEAAASAEQTSGFAKAGPPPPAQPEPAKPNPHVLAGKQFESAVAFIGEMEARIASIVARAGIDALTTANLQRIHSLGKSDKERLLKIAAERKAKLPA
jgi:hypothetical protein